MCAKCSYYLVLSRQNRGHAGGRGPARVYGRSQALAGRYDGLAPVAGAGAVGVGLHTKQ